jgi:hypothetical protein
VKSVLIWYAEGMEKFENAELHEKISVIESLPTGPENKANVVLVLVGEKPLTQIYIKGKEKASETIATLNSIGLEAEIFIEYYDRDAAEIAVTKDKALLEDLKNATSNLDHKRFGELVGFPETAIEAFVAGEEYRLPRKEQDELIKDLPQLFSFRFSKEHATEDLETYKRWVKIIFELAPNLIRDLHGEKEFNRYKEYLKNL